MLLNNISNLYPHDNVSRKLKHKYFLLNKK